MRNPEINYSTYVAFVLVFPGEIMYETRGEKMHVGRKWRIEINLRHRLS